MNENQILDQLTSLDTHKQELNSINAAWMRLVACMIHELKSTLVGLRMGGGSLRKVFPGLLAGYRAAMDNHLPISEISKKALAFAEKEISPEGIEKEITQLLEFLSQSWYYIKKLPSPVENAEVCIRHIVEDVLKEYPFVDPKERDLIHLKINHDFNSPCPPNFIEDLIFNLLSNAIRYIKQIGQGNITLWTEERERYYFLHVKDTAGAITENNLRHVFQRFFSIRNNEMHPGLGFCRLALLHCGGDILCDAIPGEYTNFVIKFPKELNI